MKRKDGLTKIFKMFLEKYLYYHNHTDEDDVVIQQVFYENQDEDFCEEMLLNFRGQTQYSDKDGLKKAMNLIHDQVHIRFVK